jgi:hypothetical protein
VLVHPFPEPEDLPVGIHHLESIVWVHFRNQQATG